MRTLITFIAIAGVAALLAFSNPLKNSSGALPGYTGSPGDGKNCTACHGGTAQQLESVFDSDIPVSGYVPGESYTITVTTSGTGRKGFQVSPQNTAGDLLGTLTAGSGNKLVGDNKYVTHSSGLLVPTASWSFAWQAPEAGTGQVVFYGAFVIGQPNVFLSTMTVQEDETIGIGEIAGKGFNIYPSGNGNMNLEYRVTSPADVTFKLYDLSGRLIYENNQGYKGTGDYIESLWLQGSGYGNICIAVLEIGNERFSKKILY